MTERADQFCFPGAWAGDFDWKMPSTRPPPDSTRDDAGGQIDDHPLAAQHVVAARHDDVSDQGDGVGAHVEFGAIADGALLLLGHDDVALRLHAPDLLVAAAPSGAGAFLAPTCLCRLCVVVVEDDERIAAHLGFALDDVHVAR